MCGIAAGLLGAYIAFCWPFTVDDAFITFRYSQNVAAGYGPTFNPGVLPHAEGYTSVLWMLIMVGPHLLGWDAVLVSKLLGILATLGTLAIAARFVYYLTSSLDLRVRQTCSALVVLLLAAYYPTAVHAISGLETALFAFLLTGFLYLVTVYVASPSRGRAAGLASAALVLGLTRPEGNLVAVVGFCGAALMLTREQKRTLFASALFGYVTPGALYFAWRLAYYGLLFPIPVYVKVGAMPLFAGLSSIAGFAGYLGIHIGVLLIFGFLRFSKTLAPAFLAIIAMLMFLVFPAPIMAYDWRYCFPIAPFVFVIAATGFANLSGWLRHSVEYPASAHRAALGGLTALIVLGLVAESRDGISEKRDYAEAWNSTVVPLGKELQMLTSLGARAPESPVIALVDAGAIPYYSKWRAVDTFTLNDPHIALANDLDPAYVLDQKPDVVVLISVDQDTFVPFIYSEGPLYKAAIAQGMVTVGKLTVENHTPYIYWVMAPRGSAIGERLAGLLGKGFVSGAR
jgi:arabinofuranosyltransferase